MRYLDLFSGIGGFTLGIQQAHELLHHAHGSEKRGIETDKEGNEGQGLLTKEGKDTGSKKRPISERPTNLTNERPLCIGYSEIDKYAIQTYQKHFPEHKNYGDITKINADELPDFDLLVGGFPCQSFSIAGKRGGFSDTRGTLFFEIARIIREKQPRLFLLENVKGLLSHDEGRTFRTIITTLDELGYDLEWQVLNSKNHGVPQNRERVFIIGHLRGTPRPEVFPFGDNSQAFNELSRQYSNTLTTRYYGGQANGTYITESKLDAQIEQLNQPTHSNDRVYGTDGISPILNTMQGGNRQPFVNVVKRQRNEFGKSIRKAYEAGTSDARMKDIRDWVDVLQTHSNTLTGVAIDNLIRPSSAIRRLTPTECERLQGFPDDWTEGLSDSQRYKCLGNAVTVNVIQAIMERLLVTYY